ncbi:MAG: hypothetical protein H3C51_03885 [Rubellimicrobium sp.]|nr:hypothetical protein [Rubellimicrobium sp.]
MKFALRWVFAFLLVALTYNPTRWNYIAWVRDHFTANMPLAILLGLILFAGYVVFVSATLRSIGPFGVILVLALLLVLLWFLADSGILSLQSGAVNTWLGIIALSVVLGTGMTWSIIWRRISGQIDVDDADN